jgi:hypothetical protein
LTDDEDDKDDWLTTSFKSFDEFLGESRLKTTFSFFLLLLLLFLKKLINSSDWVIVCGKLRIFL